MDLLKEIKKDLWKEAEIQGKKYIYRNILVKEIRKLNECNSVDEVLQVIKDCIKTPDLNYSELLNLYVLILVESKDLKQIFKCKDGCDIEHILKPEDIIFADTSLHELETPLGKISYGAPLLSNPNQIVQLFNNEPISNIEADMITDHLPLKYGSILDYEVEQPYIQFEISCEHGEDTINLTIEELA